MIPTCISTLFRTLQIELREAHKTLFPISFIELVLFLFFFLSYGFLEINILYHTNLIDMPHGNGSYLGYDNLHYLHTKGGTFDICHPFFNIFHIPKALLMNLLTNLWNAKISTILCLFITNLLISEGLVLIYRYLKQIVSISTFRAIILTLFTGFFFTTIILSFTIETYTFSFFLLIFSLLRISQEYKLKGSVKSRTIFFLSFLCGGVTLTNAAKPLMAVLLNPTSLPNKIHTGFKIMIPFITCVTLIFTLYTIKIKLQAPEEPSPIEMTAQLSRYFIYEETFRKQALIDFWGNTVMTTPLTLQTVGKETVLRPSEYPYIWQNGVIILLLLLMTISICINIKNKYVQLLLMYLSIDFIIHFIFRYGMNEAIIFGGHWMYAIPFLLGWLYTRLPNKTSKILDCIILLLLLLTITQNCSELMRLWEIYKI